MASYDDPRLEIETLTDDDLEAVSGGKDTSSGPCNTSGSETCNTSGGTCDTAVGATCNTTGGTCNNGSEDPLPEGSAS